MGKKKSPKVINSLELEKKKTRELLGYLKSLHACEESFEKSDMEINLDLINNEIIYFKQTDKWELAYKKIKSILATREDLE